MMILFRKENHEVSFVLFFYTDATDFDESIPTTGVQAGKQSWPLRGCRRGCGRGQAAEDADRGCHLVALSLLLAFPVGASVSVPVPVGFRLGMKEML